jgi:hypothetical protein
MGSMIRLSTLIPTVPSDRRRLTPWPRRLRDIYGQRNSWVKRCRLERGWTGDTSSGTALLERDQPAKLPGSFLGGRDEQTPVWELCSQTGTSCHHGRRNPRGSDARRQIHGRGYAWRPGSRRATRLSPAAGCDSDLETSSTLRRMIGGRSRSFRSDRTYSVTVRVWATGRGQKLFARFPSLLVPRWRNSSKHPQLRFPISAGRVAGGSHGISQQVKGRMICGSSVRTEDQ